jgi:hypothetical protein
MIHVGDLGLMMLMFHKPLSFAELLLLGASPRPIAYDHVLHVGTVPGRWSHVAEAIQIMKSVGEDGWSSMKHCHFLIICCQLKGTSSHSAGEPCCCWCPQCVFHVSSAEG